LAPVGPFRERGHAWEAKLQRVLAIFELWMEVQQKWVYLDGIFSGSADIRALLQNESAKFHSLSVEYKDIMKKTSKNPHVLAIIEMPVLLESLQRFEDTLVWIKEKLADYLEKQRGLFPRFYFVGDEDLLQIIGNAKDLHKLQPHFKKFFTGIARIVLADDNTTVLGCASSEGEEVMFHTPVATDGQKIVEWLNTMEREISISLAGILESAVKRLLHVEDNAANAGGVVDAKQYLGWIDTYQAQIVVLGNLVSWTRRVERALQSSRPSAELTKILNSIEEVLNMMADAVLLPHHPILMKKFEHVMTELVHQRDVTKGYIDNGINSVAHFDWLAQMRYYFNQEEENPLLQLQITIANADFVYGFEYLGIGTKLVQTPLTDVGYTTMTQGLKACQGGAPFGPAGTGKTETVKMLARQLGR
jgi:dynein heavy chain 1